jgi:hypothetical protein
MNNTCLTLSHPWQIKTVSAKEWQNHCKYHDRLLILRGRGYRLCLRSIGGGVYELYAKLI